MDESTAPITPRQLGLSLAIPEGIDAQRVAQRKKMLLQAQAYDATTGDGQMQAERAALEAEIQQAAHMARVADTQNKRNARDAKSGSGMTLAEAIAINEQQPGTL